MIFVKLLKSYRKHLIKYFIGNTLIIYGLKLHQITLLLKESINNLSGFLVINRHRNITLPTTET